MKKSSIVFLLGIFWVSTAWAQIPCGETLSDSIRGLYLQDAEQLAVRNLYENNLDGMSDIELDEESVDLILRTLLAVYQQSDLAHWEEIFEQFSIHADDIQPTRYFQIVVDTGIIEIGEVVLNASFHQGYQNTNLSKLWQSYDFDLSGEITWMPNPDNPTESFLVMPLKTIQGVNLLPLLQELKRIKGVLEAKAIFQPANFNKDISYKYFDNYRELTYRFSWDCEDATETCKNHHYWTYRIYPDCRVAFVNEAGATLPIRELNALLSTGLFPNPTTDKVFVQILGPAQKDIQVILFSALGQILQSEIVNSNTGLIQMDFSLKDQPVGMYFLGLITAEGKVLTEKILKR